MEDRNPAAEPAAAEAASADAPAAEPVAAEPITTDLGPTQPPEAPSPFASLSPQAGRVATNAFEALTRSSGELRRASFYIALLFTPAVAPLVLLLWRVVVEFESMSIAEQVRSMAGVELAVGIGVIIAVIGAVVASIESRAIASLILAATLEGRRLAVRDAVRRSRQIFWRLVGASVLISIPIYIVQSLLGNVAASLLRGESELSIVGAALLTTALFSPFAYVITGVVLGDVGALESIRRSVRLFRARKAAALVVAMFAWGAELLTGFGLAAGLDLVVRVAGLTDLFMSSDPSAVAVTEVVVIALVIAIGTLLFTVTAISLAPQVVMFLALTHVAPGLDRARPIPSEPRRSVRWLTWPYLGLAVLAFVLLLAGLNALGG